MVREQRWLELAKHQEVSERLDNFVSSRSARPRNRTQLPEPEEVLRFLTTLNGIGNPEHMAEVLELAERLARDAPGYKELMDRRQVRH